MWKSAGSAPSLRVLPRHFPYNRGKRTEKPQDKKNLNQVKKNLSQSTLYILPKYPHITKPSQTHALQKTHTHTHITKQYKSTTVQIKTKAERVYR
jgi:hypothetical protein